MCENDRGAVVCPKDNFGQRYFNDADAEETYAHLDVPTSPQEGTALGRMH